MTQEPDNIPESRLIHGAEDFAHKIKDLNVQSLNKKEESLRVHHAQVATLTIKILNTIKIDPFVRKVMTLRILGPLVTGREKTHLSIALELGTTVDEVIEAEKWGVAFLGEMMEKFSNKDFIEKFNRDEAVNRAVINELGKSASDMQKPTKEN